MWPAGQMWSSEAFNLARTTPFLFNWLVFFGPTDIKNFWHAMMFVIIYYSRATLRYSIGYVLNDVTHK